MSQAKEEIIVTGTTSWTHGSLAALTANDFVALDGSNEKPDFSDSGAPMKFGFWRNHSRVGDTPVPYNQNLVIDHGIDNFSVTLQTTPPANRPPVATSDFLFYFNYFFGGLSIFPVLANDSDPDGDPIRIISVGEPNIGTIASFNDNSVTYYVESTLFPIFFPNVIGDGFTYYITDGQDSSGTVVFISFCACPIECLPPVPGPSPNSAGAFAIEAARSDTLDVDLFRQFRDEVLLSRGNGSRFVDLYYRNAPEVMPLLLFDRPELGLQAMTALQMMQDPMRNLLDGDGSEVISQTLVDSVIAFLDSFTAAASDSLRDSLNVELARLGPLQDLVGLPVSAAVDQALGDSVATAVRDNSQAVPTNFVLQQNFPNPFNPSTQITYSLPQATHVQLTIFNIQGQKIRTLVNDFQTAGTKSVTWNGLDDQGLEITSGVYFFRLKAGNEFQKTKKMIFMK